MVAAALMGSRRLDRPIAFIQYTSSMQRSKTNRKPRRATPRGAGATTVFEAIRKRILALQLQPGVDLEEAALVREFDLSRTPVREALIQLASHGLVQLVPNRGARVAALDLNEVPQLLESLELYQRATTRWAALRRQPEHVVALTRLSRDFAAAVASDDLDGMTEVNRLFHGVIADACGNRFLAADCRAAESRTVRLARAAFGSARSLVDHAEHFRSSVEQHEAIIEAIRNGDADRADQLARVHCEVFRQRMAIFIAASAAGELDLAPRETPLRPPPRRRLAAS
jgi:DNA-binding GntR family transcriptional regulator